MDHLVNYLSLYSLKIVLTKILIPNLAKDGQIILKVVQPSLKTFIEMVSINSGTKKNDQGCKMPAHFFDKSIRMFVRSYDNVLNPFFKTLFDTVSFSTLKLSPESSEIIIFLKDPIIKANSGDHFFVTDPLDFSDIVKQQV